MKRLVFEFPDAESRSSFVGWFLDGSGEQEFWAYREGHDEISLVTDTPEGHEQWDWQRLGPDADEHVIVMVAPED